MKQSFLYKKRVAAPHLTRFRFGVEFVAGNRKNTPSATRCLVLLFSCGALLTIAKHQRIAGAFNRQYLVRPIIADFVAHLH